MSFFCLSIKLTKKQKKEKKKMIPLSVKALGHTYCILSIGQSEHELEKNF